MGSNKQIFFWRSPVATGDWSTDRRGALQAGAGGGIQRQAGRSGVTNIIWGRLIHEIVRKSGQKSGTWAVPAKYVNRAR